MGTVERGFKIKIANKKILTINSQVFVYLFILVLVGFMALPLIYVVTTAFKPIDEILRFPPQFFVVRPTLNNFLDLTMSLNSSSVPFLRFIYNSVVTTVATVALTVIFSSLTAYAMVKLKVPFANGLFLVIIGALMFPPQVTQITNYIIVQKLGFINTYWALIVPKIAVAFNLFLVKQFCEQLPDAILEAARIDGASELKIFRKIVVPFLVPAWATLIVFTFVLNWNDYFSPLVFINKQELKTLPIALSIIAEQGNVARAGAVAAATFLMTLPTVVLFTVMQKRVIETMGHSGIKG